MKDCAAARCAIASLVCYVAASAATSALAVEPAPKLAPSSKFTIVFPDLPPTFYRLDKEEKIPTQMTIFLPTNYDRNRKHPLLIFLEGGNGGGATNPLPGISAYAVSKAAVVRFAARVIGWPGTGRFSSSPLFPPPRKRTFEATTSTAVRALPPLSS